MDIEIVAGLLAVAAAAQVAVAAFAAPAAFDGWFPGRQLVAALPLAAPLCAWALRRFPRVGTALALLTVAEGVWLYAYLRLGHHGWLELGGGAPWGGIQNVLPKVSLLTVPG